MFEARVEKDSIGMNGRRITTMVITYPRFIHSELMTHRAFARNAASSRAIPWLKMMRRIQDEPVIPIHWGAEQKGMQTGGEIDDVEQARQIWLEARDRALDSARKLAEVGVHKSLVNRLTEPFMWITVVVTATEWENFYRLRCHPDAEIHFQKLAGMIRDARAASKPAVVPYGQWHLPFIDQHDIDYVSMSGMNEEDAADTLRKMSVARCARVSYLTHDGTRDMRKDLELFEKLANGSGFGHWSPHEHVATPSQDRSERSGPFVGWVQYRKLFHNENVPG